MSKKFLGELEYIKPDFLVKKDSTDRLETFFIGLGVVFNDLNGIILFEKLLIENYEKPSVKEVTVHAGSYGGVLVQIQKLVASTISEFFVFLKEYNDVTTSPEFKYLLEKIPKQEKDFWENLTKAANGKFPEVDKLLKTFTFIRSNITFHYDHSGKTLNKAFISRFFGEDQSERSKYAYYTIGNSIDTTRFFFSDAVVEESLYLASGKKFKAVSIGDMSIENYKKQVLDTIYIINTTILSLFKKYLKGKRNQPHRV